MQGAEVTDEKTGTSSRQQASQMLRKEGPSWGWLLRDPRGDGEHHSRQEPPKFTWASYCLKPFPLLKLVSLESSPTLRHTFPSLKELPRDFGCQVSFPSPQGELFFSDLGLTSLWPVMSILKMEDDYITASPCSRRKSYLRPVVFYSTSLSRSFFPAPSPFFFSHRRHQVSSEVSAGEGFLPCNTLTLAAPLSQVPRRQ